MKTSSLASRADALKELRRIPGVGPSLAHDLLSLGISKVAQLRSKNPERLYRQLEAKAGAHVDRCVLYVFRCAIYFAENDRPDPELLKWWNWKDEAMKPKLTPKPKARASMTQLKHRGR